MYHLSITFQVTSMGFFPLLLPQELAGLFFFCVCKQKVSETGSNQIEKVYFAKVKNLPVVQPQEVVTTCTQDGWCTA